MHYGNDRGVIQRDDIPAIDDLVTDGTKELLLDGTLNAVIDQNPRVACQAGRHRPQGIGMRLALTGCRP